MIKNMQKMTNLLKYNNNLILGKPPFQMTRELGLELNDANTFKYNKPFYFQTKPIFQYRNSPYKKPTSIKDSEKFLNNSPFLLHTHDDYGSIDKDASLIKRIYCHARNYIVMVSGAIIFCVYYVITVGIIFISITIIFLGIKDLLFKNYTTKNSKYRKYK